MECTSILEPGGQSYLLVTGVYQDPLAHCDSVFIRQNGTRQYSTIHTYTQISARSKFQDNLTKRTGVPKMPFFRFIVVGDFFRSLPQIKNCVEIKYHRYIEYTGRIKYPSHPILYFSIQITEQCGIGLCQNTTYISYVIYIYKYLS